MDAAASKETTETSSAPATSTTPTSDQPPTPPPPSSTSSFARPSSSPASTPTQNPQPSTPQNPPPPQNPQPHPTNPTFQNPQQRPPLGRARPFPNFSPHPPPSSSTSPSSSSSSSSSSSLSATVASSSSLPVPPIQRGGLALGVPAMRPPQQAGGSFSAFGQGSFNQHFGGLSRTPATIQDSVANSISQARPSLPGVQTIGMIGSLGSSSQMRASGAPILQQQKSALPAMRSQAAPTNPSLTSQKFQSHGMLRGPTIGSQNSPSPSTSQGSQIHQQSWMAAQGKQMQTPSYRPQQQQQPQLQQPHMRPHQSLEQYGQQYPSPRALQVTSHQQQSIRTPGLANQKSAVPVNMQPSMVQAGQLTTLTSSESSDGGNHILSKRSIQELVTQIDPSEKLEPEVEGILVDIAEDFVESITTFACSLAKHRKSNTLEAKDILLHLERNWNMTLPGFSGDEIKSYKKPLASDIHRERLTMIKKSAAVAESGITKVVATNAKGHTGKVSALGTERS